MNFKRTGAPGMRIRTGIAVAMVALTGAACDLDLDVTNPNAATEATSEVARRRPAATRTR